MSDDRISTDSDALGSSQYQPTNPVGDVDEEVRLEFLAFQAAVNPALLRNLGMQQDARYQQARHPHDLHTAVQCCELATKATSYVDYVAHLHRLVGLFDSRFQTDDSQLSLRLDALEGSFHQNQPTNPMGDFIDEAFRLGFLALRVAVDPALLESLGTKLYVRYEQTQDIEDLNLAVEYSRLATKMTTYDDPHRKPCLELLAELLERRFQSTNLLSDLNSAIRLTRATLIGTGHTIDDLIPYWLDLGERLGKRFGAIGNIVDVDEAIGYLTQAVKVTTEDSPFFVNVLGELAFNLNLRYERMADPKDLERAISLRQRVFQATVDQDELWLDCLRDLGRDLEARYKYIGRFSDLQGAINLAHIAIAKMEIVGPNYHLIGDFFYELGTKLGLLYQRTNVIDDLDEAIVCSRKAVGATGAPIEVFRHLEHLLTLRYKETHQSNDSEEAGKWAEEAGKWAEEAARWENAV